MASVSVGVSVRRGAAHSLQGQQTLTVWCHGKLMRASRLPALKTPAWCIFSMPAGSLNVSAEYTMDWPPQ